MRKNKKGKIMKIRKVIQKICDFFDMFGNVIYILCWVIAILIGVWLIENVDALLNATQNILMQIC